MGYRGRYPGEHLVNCKDYISGSLKLRLKEELKRSEMEMNRIIRMRIARRDGLRADSPQEQQGGERGAEIKVSNY